MRTGITEKRRNWERGIVRPTGFLKRKCVLLDTDSEREKSASSWEGWRRLPASPTGWLRSSSFLSPPEGGSAKTDNELLSKSSHLDSLPRHVKWTGYLQTFTDVMSISDRILRNSEAQQSSAPQSPTSSQKQKHTEWKTISKDLIGNAFMNVRRGFGAEKSEMGMLGYGRCLD